MIIKAIIQEMNRTEDGARIRRFVDNARMGVRTNQGLVTFDYNELRELFQRCDPTIDASRFEGLMQIADSQ